MSKGREEEDNAGQEVGPYIFSLPQATIQPLSPFGNIRGHLGSHAHPGPHSPVAGLDPILDCHACHNYRSNPSKILRKFSCFSPCSIA
jgi:hypothetical protein